MTVRPGNLNRLRPTLPARNPSAALAPPSVRAFSIWGWNITGGRGNKSEPAPAEKAETSSTTSTPPASETTSTTTGTVSTPDGAAAAATPAPDAPAEAVSSGAEAIDAVAPNLAAELAEIPETFGYLKALGLDYGWGPSTLVEYLLESIHLYTGLPWWASVVTAAVAIRAVLFKATLGASDTAAKMNEIKPRITPLNQRMLALYQAGDTAGSLALRKEVQQIQHEHGLKPWKAMLPLIQVPIGFGCFRVMRGMSSLPVPGLESEHLLWLTDVSVNDPYFILPVLTGTMMYFSIKVRLLPPLPCFFPPIHTKYPSVVEKPALPTLTLPLWAAPCLSASPSRPPPSCPSGPVYCSSTLAPRVSGLSARHMHCSHRPSAALSKLPPCLCVRRPLRPSPKNPNYACIPRPYTIARRSPPLRTTTPSRPSRPATSTGWLPRRSATYGSR